MRKNLRIAACYFKLNVASALEYRAGFISQAFGMALSNSSFVFFWWVAFGQIGGAIAGYEFSDVMFIWAVASSGYGLSHVLFANASRLTELIATGELDTYLSQPCDALLGVLCSRTSLSAYGDFAYGIILLALAGPTGGAVWLWFAYGTALFAALITAVILTAHSLSFFWGNASAIGQMATEFAINFSIYPDKIYAPAIRAVMYSLIPVGFAVHVPLGMVREPAPTIIAATACGAAIYCAFSAWLFNRGLKRYESGNAIVVKL